MNNQKKITTFDSMTIEQLNNANLSSSDLNLLKQSNPQKYDELNTYKQNKTKLDIINGKNPIAETTTKPVKTEPTSFCYMVNFEVRSCKLI